MHRVPAWRLLFSGISKIAAGLYSM